MNAWVQGAMIAADIGTDLFKSKQDWGRQKKMAQNQIQWRVADAKKAGIHPLYALGAAPMHYSAQAGESTYFRDMGQSIERARMANMDAQQRKAELARTAIADRMAMERHAVEMEGLRLENKLTASQIARANSAQLGPPAPSLGRQPEAGPGVIPRPSEPIVGAVGNPARQPGVITDYQYFYNGDGTLGIVPSEEMKQRIEDNLPAEVGWFLRNNVETIFRPPRAPDPRHYPLPAGYDHWEWDRVFQRFRPARRSSWRSQRGNRRW